MRKVLVGALVSVTVLGGVAATTPAQAGCVTGAIIGGVAGHFMGRHGLVGAAAGCAIGHARKVQQRRDRQYDYNR